MRFWSEIPYIFFNTNSFNKVSFTNIHTLSFQIELKKMITKKLNLNAIKRSRTLNHVAKPYIIIKM